MCWSRSLLPFGAVLAIGGGAFADREEVKPAAAEASRLAATEGAAPRTGNAEKPEAAAEKAGEPVKGPGKLSVPVPPGRDTLGLVIPDRDGEGKMRMRFAMELGKRVDVDHLDMTKLMIEIFDANQKPEMTIDLPRSLLDLNTRIITTQTGVLIKRWDFRLTGDKMAFNTATRKGKLVGNVRMLIYNLEHDSNSPAAAGSEK